MSSFNPDFETRIKIQQIINSQLPEFVLSESQNIVEFLKQYYISQEYQGGPVDILDNLDQYINLEKLDTDLSNKSYTLTADVSQFDTEIFVSSTVGFPREYGLLKINDEIITYTGITTSSFTGCIRGFSGIDSYTQSYKDKEAIFKKTEILDHSKGDFVVNLSSLFLKEFFNKVKFYLTPGLENNEFVSGLNVRTFIKNSKSFYQSKGTEESFRILFNVLYGVTPKVVDLENYLIKPSSAEYVRRQQIICEYVSGDNPLALSGQTIFSADKTASGPVSEVEIFSRNYKTYYRLSIYEGYDDRSLIEGEFKITPKTKVVDAVSSFGSDGKTITVDSTIGFTKSGSITSGNNIITYSDKSVNQFFNCIGIEEDINSGDEIIFDDYIFGYEGGDLTKEVRLRITGILSDFTPIGNPVLMSENDKIYVNNLGDYIKNSDNRTYKEILFNSWIYNTSSRYQIHSSQSNTKHVTKEDLDPSSIRKGDYVDILLRGQNTVIATAEVEYALEKNIEFKNYVQEPTYDFDLRNTQCDFRRKIRYLTSNFPTKYENITSNVQNTYNENDDYIYVASNSIPESINVSTFSLTLPNGSSSYVNSTEDSIIFSVQSLPFITGDEIVYDCESDPIVGLQSATKYYVKVVDGTPNKIKLSASRSLIYSNDFISLSSISAVGTHKFELSRTYNKKIVPKKNLVKLPLVNNSTNGLNQETIASEPVGTLINGVDIFNYKGKDRVYYGPIKSIDILNTGTNYDVINPPLIEISSGIGSTALVQPHLTGSLKEVLLETKDVEIQSINSIVLSGGNGFGAVISPVVEKKYKEYEFFANLGIGVGINTITNEITFSKNHNIKDGQPLVYNSNGNLGIGIRSFNGPILDSGNYLTNGAVYYPKVVNPVRIKLYQSFNDYNLGINTVGFTTTNASGLHKFRSLETKNILADIKVIESGSNYQNKKLILNPSSISTSDSLVVSEEHGFKNGELVEYLCTGSVISGLSTTSKYKILKIDNNKFRLADSGSEGKDDTNFKRNNYARFYSQGSGYHIFKYPDIQISINVSYAQTDSTIVAKPIVRGSIEKIHIYETGSGYGSEILNFHRRPNITTKIGKNASLKPIIVNGKIISVVVNDSGEEYYSIPDLIVSGSGKGAKLHPIIENNKIIDVLVLRSGIGYDSNTTVGAFPPGSEFKAQVNVRELTVNNYKRYGDYYLNSTLDGLTYSVLGYSDEIKNYFQDNITDEIVHSPIIGWAYDGNPIYGPYGYSDPTSNYGVKILSPSYSLIPVDDRPNSFPNGFFVEDYVYTGNGDLDEHNGRFSKTPEFPNGIYAYYVGIKSDNFNTNQFESVFPYFVGNTYRSKFLSDLLTLNQEFNFEQSDLVRNTFPYRTGQKYSSNDFIDEFGTEITQVCSIDSVTSGSIDSYEIVNPGINYKVNDALVFDNEGTGGYGAAAKISEIKLPPVSKIVTGITTYTNSKITKLDQNRLKIFIQPSHDLISNEYITISGLSTYVKNLAGNHLINFEVPTTSIVKTIPSANIVGFVTDIYVNNIPQIISIGSSVGIGTEIATVLNYYPVNKILRIKRHVVGVSHTVSSIVSYIPDYFIINLETNKNIQFNKNVKTYFNPIESIGFGTATGITTSNTYTIGELSYKVDVPTQSIYLPEHQFNDNEQIILRKPTDGNAIQVSDSSNSTIFNLPFSGNEQLVYVIKKSKNYIGISTQVGLTTTGGLYFRGYSSVGLSTDYQYSFESVKTEVTAKVEKIVSTVSISTSHNLSKNDRVKLDIVPNSTIGLGNSSFVKIKYNSNYKKLLVNPIGFTSSAINVDQNTINLGLHDLNTGDKVFYDADDFTSSGLSTGPYYVYKVDDNNIKLSNNYSDIFQEQPIFVSIAGVGIGSSGGISQRITRINPHLLPIKGNNIKFDVSDSSLSGYEFKFYSDNSFINEFESTTETSSFNIVRSGVVGVSSQANIILNYDEKIPESLYYSIEKIGEVLYPDKDVINFSKISYVPSIYNGNYTVSSVGSTSFTISLNKIPERLSYEYQNLTNSFVYTSSSSSSGEISKIKTISGGFGYKKLPKSILVETSTGSNALIYPKTTSIGNIKEITVLNQGFSYPSDKTLKPKALLPVTSTLKNNNQVSSVVVEYGGRGYYSRPDLVLVNSISREAINNGSLNPIIKSNSITDVEIVSPPRGLDSTKYELFSVNNTNGIGISSISYSTFTGNVTCTLFTPIAGYPQSNIPFEIGDLIFVEGIEKIAGKGFNSSDYGYVFFEVTNYVNTNPAVITFNLSNYTSNAGVPKLSQTRFASIVNYKNYPRFSIAQKTSKFIIGEQINISYGSNLGFVGSDLMVSDYGESYVKLIGSDQLENGYIIQGEKSASKATISLSESNSGQFAVNSTSPINFGWKNEIGKLSVDTQFLPDNDYYQNLSYTVKSPIEYDRAIDPINKLLHPKGLKNFVDVGITSETKYQVNNASVATIVVDLIEDSRVDTLSNFDNAIDFDVREKKSKFIDLYNKKLSNYIKCISNRALQIDDISDEFSNKSFTQEEYLNVITYPRGLRYSKFLVQTIGIGTNEYQVDDLVVLNDLKNTYTFNRGTLSNLNSGISSEFPLKERYVDLYGNIDEYSNLSLRLDPENPYEKSYEVKVYRNTFTASSSGIGTTSFGFIDITSSTKNVNPEQSLQIVGIQTGKINAIYAEILLIENNTNTLNFFEVVVNNDGNNTTQSEYYFDTSNTNSLSDVPLGSFESDISGGNLVLNFNSDSLNPITVKSRVIGIGTTSAGIGTYRFKSIDQPDETERSLRLESNFKILTSPGEIITVDRSLVSSYKSIVRIKNNDKISLHEILYVNDGENAFILPKYFLSVNNTTGIGTFGTEYSGYDSMLKFYPDAGLSGNFEIQTYAEILYKEQDADNDGRTLSYGTAEETISNSQFNSINGDGNDRYDFELKYNSTPIFVKKFNPTLSSILNKESGVFTIKNHFFNDNEELLYTADTAFLGLPVQPIGIGSTLSGGSLFTGDVISGLSTITGVISSENIEVGQEILGKNIQSGTTIVSIGSTYKYFKGNVVSGGSSIITGVANTSIFTVGSGIYSGDGTSVGQIHSIGIGSITSTVSIVGGNDRLYYSNELGIGISLSQVATASTTRQTFISGITTNVCPSRVYAIKINNDQFKISTTKNSGLGVTFTSSGQGNAHQFEVLLKNEKTLITIDGVVQYPLKYVNVQHTLQNNGGFISTTTPHFALSGISSIRPNDLLKIQNEYVKVINVGLGTTSLGPISNSGQYNLIYGQRGFVGSSATSHSDSTSVVVYRGSYNIVGNKIYFVDPPKGSGRNNLKNNSNLQLPRSSFVGRVFLRKNYTENIIFDDFSEEFSGIGRTYTIKKLGNNVSNIEPGSGLLFINEVFQTPTTLNNQGNNYELSSVSGTSNVTFTGVRSAETNELIVSNQDINQNQLPRGGVIISLGSTSGLGFAPLVGAAVTAVVGAGGSILSVGIGSTDIVGSGYYNQVSVAVTDRGGNGYDASVSAIVGAGGTLSFVILNGGSNYVDPKITISDPSYANLPVTGLFRIGIGTTSQTGIGLSMTLDVGPKSTTGIGSTYFEVKSFKITKSGYGFKKGDVFKPVGLVTAQNLASPLEDFKITVLETFTDSVALWQFGELDYIDSVSELQDGIRRRFPLYRNKQLLSFETDDNDPDSSVIDLDSILIIFVNGVLQEPKVAYNFTGGTTFTFTEPPKEEDKVDVFFYRGTRNVDSSVINVRETIKVGDDVRISNSVEFRDKYNQDTRTVFDILSSDSIETNTYAGVGINTVNYKHISWTKQKSDKIINNLYVSKARDSLSSLVFPTAKIISNFTSTDTEIFVDNSELFTYEEDTLNQEILSFDCILVQSNDPVSAALTATVSGGSINQIQILDGGSGYDPGSEIFLKISSPIAGIGTTAIAKVTVSAAGTVTTPTIINVGAGYSSLYPPQIIVPFSENSNRVELLSGCSFVQGFSGIITGITTSVGTGGHPLALTFFLKKSSGSFTSLQVGYPLVIDNTQIGYGLTSVNSNDSQVVGIGTTFLNNIYKVNDITSSGNVAIVTSNVKSNSNIIGISTFGENLGTFSWGRISSFNRSSNPITVNVSGYTVDVGLSTFAQIQRRGYGLRDTGSLKK